ncbi:CusA/CzcA family heavy metal efflux RND transporter [Methylophilus sp. DW102]|uniref:efflux RND transporter permease subunit n=1 Tax=Methylophilus sp. DW102 TaxID=3095607 RepID=UPI00308BA8AF|nr:CusA/CzcA family heavy metal efflux RND transporter [Methylophilus sp. DW102]
MMAKLIRQALQYKWIVIGGLVALSLLSLYSLSRMKIDAYPDISSQMVQIITVFPGKAPEDVERQVTVPLEILMKNVPNVETVRSRTIFGLSVIQLIFKEGTESYWARQRVQEKLSLFTLPPGAEAELGPLATAYGEMVRYQLTGGEGSDLVQLRTLNDWVVIPRLLRADGVAEVTNFGGYEKQYGIILNPSQLRRYDVSVNDVIEAVQLNNANSGGSLLSRGSMSFVIRGEGAIKSKKNIEDSFLKNIDGQPIYVRDVASVQINKKIPAGIFSKNTVDESVEGIVLLRKGENPSEVLARVKQAIQELNDGMLPKGVQLVPFYDRSELINSTLHTVTHSVVLGIALVLLVLFLFFGRPSLAILVALTIPVALVFALLVMYLTDIPIGLLSLGAIDFGVLVDGAIIISENIARRLDERNHVADPPSVELSVLNATLEVEKPVFVSILLIIGGFLPLISLTHIEGLLFRPMAMTIIFALIGASLFSFFVVPVLATMIFKQGFKERHNPVLERVNQWYTRGITHLLRHASKTLVVVFASLVLLLVWVVPKIGSEFLPYMDEGVVWVRANFPEGTSLEQTALFGKRLREIALQYPEVKYATIQTGRNDSGTDPYPPSRIEMMIVPQPHERWQQFATKAELIVALGQAFRNEFPTTRFNFTQPIIDSVTEDSNGTSADMAVEFSGPDLDVLLGLARQSEDWLKTVDGAVDVNIEQEGPQPQLVITPNRALCARYKVNIHDLSAFIDNAIGGAPVGVIYEGERRFDIVAKFDKAAISSVNAIERLPVTNTDGVTIPLSQVATIRVVDGQTIIARGDGKHRITVRSDIRGRDQGGFVAEAQQLLAQKMVIPNGYRMSWIGMYENLDRAANHFKVLVPLTMAIIFAILFFFFKSYRDTLVVLSVLPAALAGGLLALFMRGMHLNVSTGVGFAAVFGVSIMSGVLMVKTIKNYSTPGQALHTAIIEGASVCMRPVMMASLVAILGLLPASLATGLGSDVQRPLATVIVWGLFFSSVISLFILPVMYQALHGRNTKPETASALV